MRPIVGNEAGPLLSRRFETLREEAMSEDCTADRFEDDLSAAFGGACVSHRLAILCDDPRPLLAEWLLLAPAAELRDLHITPCGDAFSCRFSVRGLRAAEARRLADALVARGVAREAAVEHRIEARAQSGRPV